MKANSVAWELTIILSQEEIISLEKSPLAGKIKVWDRDETIGLRDIEITRGEVNRHQAFAEISSFPSGVYVDKVTKYTITLSDEGYQNLKNAGSTGDRMVFNAGAKVQVYSENKSRER